MKTVLITAGPVYGKLDDNKLVSNRSRGLWVTHLLPHLTANDYFTVLVVPDIMRKQFEEWEGCNSILIVYHSGYHSYADICYEWAPKVDAAIMAAAVVNYIPKTPYPGKMPTDKEEVLIPFILAPRVIDRMREINPSLTLIGCKLLFSDDYDKLIEAAYHVVLRAKCNAVIANDGRLGLRKKFMVHQDRTVVAFDDDFDGLYGHLMQIMEDNHYRTVVEEGAVETSPDSRAQFDRIINRYRDRFVCRVDGEDFVFGAVCVRSNDGYLVSPREKGHAFTSEDAAVVSKVVNRTVHTRGGKATLNAPLLIRHLEKYPEAAGVVHFHVVEGTLVPFGIPTVPYAPPGTVRDNDREVPGLVYVIKGHGWIVAVDEEGEPLRAV